MSAEKRFEIESPVTVGVKVLGNGRGLKLGRLCDIGVRGARFLLEKPLPVRTEIFLLVHFRDPLQRATTLQFEGVVVNVSGDELCEIDVRFRKGVRFRRGGLSDLLKHLPAKWELPPDYREMGRTETRQSHLSN
jgi:hypothetical protein